DRQRCGQGPEPRGAGAAEREHGDGSGRGRQTTHGLLSLRVPVLDESIPEPDHGFDVVPAQTQLGPQPTDVSVDTAQIDLRVVAPDAVEEALPGEHAPGALDEDAEQLELLGREAQVGPAVARDERIELHLEVRVAITLGGRRLRAM